METFFDADDVIELVAAFDSAPSSWMVVGIDDVLVGLVSLLSKVVDAAGVFKHLSAFRVPSRMVLAGHGRNLLSFISGSVLISSFSSRSDALSTLIFVARPTLDVCLTACIALAFHINI